jgi:serine protease Do
MALTTTLRSIVACFLGAHGLFVCAEPTPEVFVKLQSATFKVTAERSSGTVQAGSAVLVAENRLITNCHVLTWARKIQVLLNGERWPAKMIAADQEHDLCLLSTTGIPFAAATFGNPLQIGQAVHAAGFPGGGEFNISCGVVRALHPFDSAKVIQTNANFNPGASGGGLFDNDGNLVGILTFKAQTGGDFHFVMPVAWVEALVARADGVDTAKNSDDVFYRRNGSKQPFFLQAATLEAQQNWIDLLDVAQRWNNQQADSVESLMAIGKACVALSKKDQAISAFRRVLVLDSQHSLGKDWLRAIEPAQPCGDASNPCAVSEDILAFVEPVLP